MNQVIDTAKFPFLMKDEGIVSLVQKIERESKQVQSLTTELAEKIQTVQENCQHVWKEERKYDKYFASAYKSGGSIGQGLNVLESRMCTKCGLHEDRPKGMPWVICHSCWFPMKYSETIPGQGERTRVYECTNPNCSHASWHT